MRLAIARSGLTLERGSFSTQPPSQTIQRLRSYLDAKEPKSKGNDERAFRIAQIEATLPRLYESVGVSRIDGQAGLFLVRPAIPLCMAVPLPNEMREGSAVGNKRAIDGTGISRTQTNASRGTKPLWRCRSSRKGGVNRPRLRSGDSKA
jgi:hypothetical protein